MSAVFDLMTKFGTVTNVEMWILCSAVTAYVRPTYCTNTSRVSDSF